MDKRPRGRPRLADHEKRVHFGVSLPQDLILVLKKSASEGSLSERIEKILRAAVKLNWHKFGPDDDY